MGIFATTNGTGHGAPSVMPVKVTPDVVATAPRGTSRSVAAASDGAGGAPTLRTIPNPAGRVSQFVAVGLSSFAALRRRIAATAAGILAAGTVPVVNCDAENVLDASAVLSTAPRPTCAFVTPDTVPVNVGELIGAFVVVSVAACAATAATSALSAGRSVTNCATLS